MWLAVAHATQSAHMVKLHLESGVVFARKDVFHDQMKAVKIHETVWQWLM